jgi:hypothetical protein
MIELKINNRVRTSAPNKTGDVDMIIIERKKKQTFFGYWWKHSTLLMERD